MLLPDVLRPSLTAEAQSVFEALPPPRRRVALQMMVAAAHMTGLIHIEQVEEIQVEFDRLYAAHLANYLTERMI